MKARELIKRQASINNYNTLAWTLMFAVTVVILAFANALWWTWLVAIVCIPSWLILQKSLHPKCPFCNHISFSIAHSIVGKYCENCGESFDRQIIEKP